MKLTTTTAPFEMLKHIPAGSVGSPRGNCEGCGMSIWSEGGYRVSGLPGIHCSIKCIETVLFGHERCRWCGRKSHMAQPIVVSARAIVQENITRRCWEIKRPGSARANGSCCGSKRVGQRCTGSCSDRVRPTVGIARIRSVRMGKAASLET